MRATALSTWLDRVRSRSAAPKRRGVRLGVTECETRTVPTCIGLSGSVFVDANDNGTRDSGEAGIAGVRVMLVGKTDAGNPVHQVATTDANGNYAFINLAAGTYMLKELQPAGYRDGKDAVGTAGGKLVGNDLVKCIRLTGTNCHETGYNFGERVKCQAGSNGKGSDGKGSKCKGSDGKGSGGRGSHDKCAPRGSNGKGSDGRGSNGKGSSCKGSDGRGSNGKGSSCKGSDGRGSNGKGSNGCGSNGKGSQDPCTVRPKGNNGVGNGLDPQPRGNPPVNDGVGTSPGTPGNRGGAKK